MALVRTDPRWQPIMQVSNQGIVVLYNPANHNLTITNSSAAVSDHDDIDQDHDSRPTTTCPYCHRPLDGEEEEIPTGVFSRAPNYFHLLSLVNETASRPGTPHPREGRSPLEMAMADGYFASFFEEQYKIGMGANGSVFLCQHVLDGIPLGHFAVKKIAVGESHDYLLKTLREVRLLETLRHENIVTYHHSWLESCRFSSFGPSVPTLFILMQWAEGGSLDDLILSRQGIPTGAAHQQPQSPNAADDDNMSRAERIAAFRQRKNTLGARTEANLKAVHLLSLDEIQSLFTDIVSGLAFLHDRAILHLDLKPGNVLLTWDEDHLIPRAMLSDFGASKDMLRGDTSRTGVTGTLEYTAPETLRPDPISGVFRQANSKADMWSLGMILHKLIFFKLPYRATEDWDSLQGEVLEYSGFVASSTVVATCLRRGLPRSILLILESLLDTMPHRRPSCDRLLNIVRTSQLWQLQDPNTKGPDSSPNSPSKSLVSTSPENRLRELVEDSSSTVQQQRPNSPTAHLRPRTPRNEVIEDMTRFQRLTSEPPTAIVDLTRTPSHQLKGGRRPQSPQRRRWSAALVHFLHTQWIPISNPVKILKCALLIGKMYTLSTLPSPSMHSSPGRSILLCLASALAAVDMWEPNTGLNVSIGLAACHLGALHFLL